MAATYSSFMTTRFYSPVFNTALFDGPLRIYFSQSYESVALKVYHLFQSQHEDIWNSLKNHSQFSKKHLFLMIYPENKDLKMVFDNKEGQIHSQDWEEGMAVGFTQAQTDAELQMQLDYIVATAKKWLLQSPQNEISI